MRVIQYEEIEDTPEAVVDWLTDEVDSMRHERASEGQFLDGYNAAQEQVLEMLHRLREGIRDGVIE